MTSSTQKVPVSSQDSGEDIEASLLEGERIVISGMSGLYPNARHVKDLADILYNKVHPISSNDSRWGLKHPEINNYTGKVPDLNYFDAQFFKINYVLANNMDSMSRKILEQAFMAIYDAGINLNQLKGKDVGVYVGVSLSESESICMYKSNITTQTGFALTGYVKSMFANRISYWLNAKGPSMAVDQTCCSSTVALELAYRAIQRGECESAVVGGCSLHLHPHSLIHYGRLHKLSKDGKTKSYDENADGSAMSEAINVLYLQKAKDALRIYAEVVNIRSEYLSLVKDETGPKYGFYRNLTDMTEFLKRFYEESNVPPQAVEYVEGCGSAIPEVDKAELEVYEKVFCVDRNNPLLVGSIKSNVGNVEAASGITAITKILLGYHTGILAANLHCETPRRDVVALRDGRMTILRDNTPFSQGYAAVNGHSVTGVNTHLLLKGYFKPKDSTRYQSAIPHLVFISGRQNTAVTKILKDLKSRPVDPEQIALLNNIHGTQIFGHLVRGFSVLVNNEENRCISLSEKVDYFDYVKRPVWFVYSGMGSQYNGMGVDLMRIPVFASAIERCNRVLQPKGIDIVHIITSPDKEIFENILHSFVGIAAIQIGLTDVLREVGIVPDKIIGHSVGELGCAYADECFTTEEMILSAYSRGLVSVQTPFIHGSMAAVGMGYQQILPMCPPEIEVACHNSPDSCTISGPADVMREFVASLVDKNIFAKEVPCSNIAYHSRYISNAGPTLLKYLSEVIKSPKLRSERWVSTSAPIDKWDEPYAKYSSAEYYTNNLLNPVLFEETSRLIPPNAILVEIAPHGLLQSILKRSLPESCTNISLTRRGYHDNAIILLEALGKLYIEGLDSKIHKLYPKIEFPVSTGTPMLSHLVEWAHHEKWSIPLIKSLSKKFASATESVISIHDEEYKYLEGHVIGGKILYPFAHVLVAVWDTLAMTLGVAKRSRSVQFQNVMLHAQPILHDRRKLTIGVTVQRGSGRFEVMDDMNSHIASGFILDEENCSKLVYEVTESQSMNVTSKEIYDHFLSRGFAYKDSFKSIRSTNLSLTQARIQWCGNWVTFIDGMFQLHNLRHSHESYSHPIYISKVSINPDKQDKNNDALRTATVLEKYNITKCGGIIMENIVFKDLPMPIENSTPILRSLKFIPHCATNQYDFETTIQVYLQIVTENVGIQAVNVLGIYNNENNLSKFNEIKRIMVSVPEVTIGYTWLKRNSVAKAQKSIFSDINLVVTYDLTTDDNMCQIFYRILEPNTFVINIRNSINNIYRPSTLYQVVCEHRTESSHVLELVRWRPINKAAITSVISVNSPSDFVLMFHDRNSLKLHQNFIVMTTNPGLPGLKAMVNEFKQNGFNIRLVKNKCKEFDEEKIINADLAVTAVMNGVCGGEYYLPLHHLSNVKGNVTLQSSDAGQAKFFSWVQTNNQTHQNRRVPVKVHYAALNDLDAKRNTGLIPLNPARSGYGMDFSGITDSGERVMGLVKCGAVSTLVQGYTDLLWPVPSHWSLEDAATVPSAYCLAYYCLTIKNNNILRPGIRVLVHGGAGGLGQAVISLALANCCEVFATVGDNRKKQFLLKMYPDLKAENIGNSRDLTFCDLVLNATTGKGVDIVISTLSGELKKVTFKCVKANGIIVDVNQIPSRDNFEYGMSHLSISNSYITVDFLSIFKENKNEMKKLQRMLCDGIAKGWVRPLSRVTYAPGDVSCAFKLLAGSNQRGRVLLCLDKANLDNLCPLSRLQCSSENLHIIISDHLSFGQQMVDMLISRGVRKILLNLPVSPENFKLKMRQWKEAGVLLCCKCADILDVPGLLTDDLPEPVEGIYILITNKHRAILETSASLETIDAISRKKFPALKYFAVVNAVNSVGEETCISRNICCFAATMIKLPELKNKGGYDKELILIRNFVDAVERAITSNESVLSAHFVSKPPLSLLHEVATVAGVNISQDTDDSFTLYDLGMDPVKADKVSTFLRDRYNIFLTVDEVKALTVERVENIDGTLTRTDFDNDKGLNKLFTYVDTDEITAASEVVFMPTLTSSATWNKNEFDVSSPYMCIVPGVEGHHERFRLLCERLKLPAMVLQPDFARPNATVPEMARRYAEILLQSASPKTHFYLLGYESGVFVVLEMAAILEDKGFTSQVFCIGNPDQINADIKEHLKGLETKEAVQDAIVRHMFFMMTKNKTNELEQALQGVTSWEDKLKVTVRALLGKVSHSTQYAQQLIVAAYGRLMTLLEYEMKVRPLHSQLILLQPASDSMIQKSSSQRYSQQSVICYQLRAPLSQATDDLRCAVIINAHLDADILDEFENICQSYVSNSNIFTMCS